MKGGRRKGQEEGTGDRGELSCETGGGWTRVGGGAVEERGTGKAGQTQGMDTLLMLVGFHEGNGDWHPEGRVQSAHRGGRMGGGLNQTGKTESKFWGPGSVLSSFIVDYYLSFFPEGMEEELLVIPIFQMKKLRPRVTQQ